jgi:hypothetical protein
MTHGPQEHLEKPAFLGRSFSSDRTTSSLSSDRATGSLVFLVILLVLAALAYGGEGAWFLAIPCGVAALGLSIVAFRRMRALVRDELDSDPTETIETLVKRTR